MKLPEKPFNTLAKRYGLKEFNNFIEVLEGDYTLLADIPEWVGLSKLRPNLRCIGPLPLKLESDIPKQIEDLPRDKPIVFFAMGSSGKPRLIADIIEGFRDKPYRVIAPVETHIKEGQLKGSDPNGTKLSEFGGVWRVKIVPVFTL